ncbi:MAG TPA: hypothetical protein VKK79_18020, partial [Candidatus Lokiarchaeia archaeon]|nr:hypothetical protein [Candidatus Lokiarchaeia archaeon]
MVSSKKIAGIFALFLIIMVPLVGGAPQSFAPTTFHSTKAVPASNLPPLDPAWVTQQDFDGDLNQSVTFAKNASLVPYRVDVNVTGLNQTANRLENGNFASGTGGWQVPSSPGKNFSWNQSGPEGATSLQANFTGLWNSTLAYPLNDTTHIDQFDEISKWNTYTDNINVTSEIDSLSGIGTTGNYLNISWWKDRISGLNSGEDWGGASRSFFYNGSSQVNQVKIEFPYQTYFDDLIFPGTFAANIKANITITNPLGISKTIPNVVDKSYLDSFTGVSNYWFNAEITSGLESIFNCTGDYTIGFDVNITQSIGDVNPYIANMKSRFLVDNLSLIVNSSIGTFNAGEATNASQVVNLGQSVTNGTQLNVSVCAAAVPLELNNTNFQLGCAIDNTWFNL